MPISAPLCVPLPASAPILPSPIAPSPIAPSPIAPTPIPPAPVLRPFSGLPFSGLPFHGVTVLLVEDSRFASDALRLLCQKSGARLRRAETLAAAYQHLRVYRPDVVIVDLGLPDGRGEGLIRELAAARTAPEARALLVLAISGDASGREAALAAGAQGFIEKPVASLAAFQAALSPAVSPMGGLGRPQAPRHAIAAFIYGRPPEGALPQPDPLALYDDLRRAADLLRSVPDAEERHYLRGFLGGVARYAQDPDLAEAAHIGDDGTGLDRLTRLLTRRLHQQPSQDAGVFRPQ